MRIIKDPEIVQVVVERARWEIWNLLKAKGSLSADQIAEILDKDISTIYRHLKKLCEAGFVLEEEVRKGDQKYVIKKFTAISTNSLFLLSEEEERMIASQPGEIPYLNGFLPRVLEVFKELGFSPDNRNEEKKAIKLMSELQIYYSDFLVKFFGDQDEFPTLERGEDFNEVLEYMKLFLCQIDDFYSSKIEELRKILMINKILEA
ncbi:ArsR family transcriptional regulator [Candidatus Hodarchaeum mangrovi]